MPDNKTLLIFNPAANLGLAGRMDARLRESARHIPGLQWVDTQRPGHATQLALQAVKDCYELVIAVGGDGTVHEVVNGLMQAPPERRPRLSVIPYGSGNDFASAIGIETGMQVTIDQILHGEVKRVDIGRLSTGDGLACYWDNAIGIGFDTNVVIRSRRIPIVRGFIIYLLAVFQTMAFDYEAPKLHVKTDQEEWEEDLLLMVLCNGGREGGIFRIVPGARADDGAFDYTRVGRISRPMMLRLLPAFIQGSHTRSPLVRMGQFRRLELTSDRPLRIHTDGEILAGPGSDIRRLSVEILPGALEVQGLRSNHE